MYNYVQWYNYIHIQPKYEVSWPVVLVVLVVSIWKGKSLLFLRTMAPYLVNSPWLWCFSSNNALALQGHDVHGTVPTETTWHCQPTFVGDHAAEGWGPLHKSCVWNHYTSLIFLNYYWTSENLFVESSSAKCRHYFQTWHVDADSLITNISNFCYRLHHCILFHSHLACYAAMTP